MKIEASTVDEYISKLPEERQVIIQKLREVIVKNLPQGFEECMSYGMPAYAIPHSVYPAGYHCKPSEPLPFMNIASQKNHIGVYHMGLYDEAGLLKWFTEEFPKHSSRKLDMGKCCIRLKKMNDIPYELIGELATKISCEEWIEQYEKAIKKK